MWLVCSAWAAGSLVFSHVLLFSFISPGSVVAITKRRWQRTTASIPCLLFLWTCLGLYPTAAQQSQVALALNSKSRGCGRKHKTRTSPVYLTRVVPEAQQCCREGYQVCFCASEWTPVQVFLFSALFLSPQHNKALTVFARSWTFLPSLSKRKLKIPVGALKKRVHSYWPPVTGLGIPGAPEILALTLASVGLCLPQRYYRVEKTACTLSIIRSRAFL